MNDECGTILGTVVVTQSEESIFTHISTTVALPLEVL